MKILNIVWITLAFTNAEAKSLCNDKKHKIPYNDTSKMIILPTKEFKNIMANARKSFEKKKEGIPELIRSIEEHIHGVNSPNCSFVVNESAKYLYYLARKDIYSDTALPILFRVLEEFPIKDTLNAARTIEIISGVQVGYDWKFALYYKDEDKPLRAEMIHRWKQLIEDKKNEIPQ